MQVLEEVVRWAESKGVELTGIRPQRISGRGIGVVATRELKTGEIILAVPSRILRTLDTVPKSTSKRLPTDTSLHGLLAADLVIDNTSDWILWKSILPTKEDFESSTPLLWPTELQALLPKPAKQILFQQQSTFQRDWNIVSNGFPEISREQYLHAWLLVNSRTFYYLTPSMRRLAHRDRLALQPIADLFNHADHGCHVEYSAKSYTITADRTYKVGEEIYISYGGHSNDFLLAEYGFVLAKNRWDDVCLDEVILPHLSIEQKSKLEIRGFLGNYKLDGEMAGCHRTQVALRLLSCSQKQWKDFLNTGNDGEASQRICNSLLIQCLSTLLEHAQRALEDVAKLVVGQPSQRALLLERWKQIESLIKETVKYLES
ncbi:hypothetical protein MMC25_002321 [Agyrium rufum]|nr:hypothetical protein [Agyrium rufum]